MVNRTNLGRRPSRLIFALKLQIAKHAPNATLRPGPRGRLALVSFDPIAFEGRP